MEWRNSSGNVDWTCTGTVFTSCGISVAFRISVHFVHSNPAKIRQKHVAVCNLYESVGIKTELIFWHNGNRCLCTLLLPLNKRINKQINNGIPVSLDVIMLLLLGLWGWHTHRQRQQNTTGVLERIGFAVRQTDNRNSGLKQMKCVNERKNATVTVWGVCVCVCPWARSRCACWMKKRNYVWLEQKKQEIVKLLLQ